MSVPGPSTPRFSSVKTLLNGLFDYAGLFPPASLSLEDGLKEYLEHRAEPDAWMLGPFVIPVNKLADVPHLVSHLLGLEAGKAPISFIVLPSPVASPDQFLPSLRQDLEACTAFLKASEGNATIDAFEFRFPAGLFVDPSEAVQCVSNVVEAFVEGGFGHAQLFGELVRTATFEAELPVYFLSLASGSESTPIKGKILKGKIRCGGMIESDFPTSTELAGFIFHAVQFGHPFKATAGLHHPVRHWNIDHEVLMHGFLNAFFATTLARVHGLTILEIQEILDDQDPASFEFTLGGIQWTSSGGLSSETNPSGEQASLGRTLKATNTDFIASRRGLSLSIGSCSFNEPREDLFALGWLS